MSDEWYRRKTWTDADKAEFFVRHRRCREFKKAQYLRVQAATLAAVGTQTAQRAAIELLDLLLRDWPDKGELSIANCIKGKCLESLGETESAIENFRQSFQAQRDFPTSFSNCHTDFAWIAATKPIPALHQEALNVLAEFGQSDDFLPMLHFRSCAAKALIHDALGNQDLARQFASTALHAAEQKHSGLRYHPLLGLVSNPDKTVLSKLRRLVAASEIRRGSMFNLLTP